MESVRKPAPPKYRPSCFKDRADVTGGYEGLSASRRLSELPFSVDVLVVGADDETGAAAVAGGLLLSSLAGLERNHDANEEKSIVGTDGEEEEGMKTLVTQGCAIIKSDTKWRD